MSPEALLAAAVRLTEARWTSDKHRARAVDTLCKAASDLIVADRVDDDRDDDLDCGHRDVPWIGPPPAGVPCGPPFEPPAPHGATPPAAAKPKKPAKKAVK